jgi:hypothetical protein
MDSESYGNLVASCCGEPVVSQSLVLVLENRALRGELALFEQRLTALVALVVAGI